MVHKQIKNNCICLLKLKEFTHDVPLTCIFISRCYVKYLDILYHGSLHDLLADLCTYSMLWFNFLNWINFDCPLLWIIMMNSRQRKIKIELG